MAEPPRYRFGPRSTRGLLAGWSGGQLAVVALGALVALVALRSVGGAGGVLLALLAAAGGVAAAAWPVGGRPLATWAPTVGRYAARSLKEGRAPWQAAGRMRRQGPLARLALIEVEAEGAQPLAVVADGEAATWSAVLGAGGDGFALLDEEGQAGAVAAWSGVLAAMASEAGGPHRLQWVARTWPATALFGAERPVAALPVAQAYRELLAEVPARLVEREVLLAVTVAAPRPLLSSERRCQASAAAADRLTGLARSLRSRLEEAGVFCEGPLRGEALAAAFARAHELRPGLGIGTWPWPLAVEAGWAALRTDATWHAVYWVAEWPRGEVGPAVLLPLLLGGGERRSVSLTMAPLAGGRAVRRAEHERTSAAADAELRQRHGFALTARARAEQEVAMAREAELAAGHSGYLFSGYVSLTAESEEALAKSCAAVEQAAALSQLELRRVYGAQEEAWCCTLPTGRGCQ